MPAPLRLPPGVRAVRRTMPDGMPYHEFHHDGVGLLGSVIVRSDPASGRSQMDAMLAPGGPGDPLDGRRRDLLGQVVEALGGAIDERYGPAPDRTPSMPPPDIRDAAVVGHHLGRCPRCGALKYHLVFAPGAESAGDLETQVAGSTRRSWSWACPRGRWGRTWTRAIPTVSPRPSGRSGPNGAPSGA